MALSTRIVISGQDRGARQALAGVGKQATKTQRQVFGVNSALKQTDKRFSKLNRTLVGLAGAGGGFLLLGGAISAVKQALAIKVDFDRIDNTLKAVTGSTKQAKEEMGFLTHEAERLGLELRPLAGTYTRLLASTKLIGISTEETREIFTGFSEALTTFGSSRQQSIRVFAALEQIAAKGVVSMEELRQQLGEALPSAFVLGARAMGKTEEEFAKLVAQGKVLSKDFLLPFTREVRNKLGKGAVTGAKLLNAEMNRLTNTSEKLFRAFSEGVDGKGTGGFVGGFREAIESVNKELKGGNVAETVERIGSIIGTAIGKGTNIVLGLAKAFDALTSSIKTVSTIFASGFLIKGLRDLRKFRIAEELAQATATGTSRKTGLSKKINRPGRNTLNADALQQALYGAGLRGTYIEQVGGASSKMKPATEGAVKSMTKFQTALSKTGKGLGVLGSAVANSGRTFLTLAGGPLSAFSLALGGAVSILLSLGASKGEARRARIEGERAFAKTKAFKKRREILTEVSGINKAKGGANSLGEINKDIKLFQQQIKNASAVYGDYAEDVKPIFKEAINDLEKKKGLLTGEIKKEDPLKETIDTFLKGRKEQERYNKILSDMNLKGTSEIKKFYDDLVKKGAKDKRIKEVFGFFKTEQEGQNKISALQKEAQLLTSLDRQLALQEKTEGLRQDQANALLEYNKILENAKKNDIPITDRLRQRAFQVASTRLDKGGEVREFAPITANTFQRGSRALALQTAFKSPERTKEQREKQMMELLIKRDKREEELKDIWIKMGEDTEKASDVLSKLGTA